MASRLELHNELIGILGTERDVESRVYFQPPESKKLTYPCIVYSRVGVNTISADNKLYRGTTRYTITVIDKNPDTKIPDLILAHFPMCSFDRAFVSDNLNHYTITLYY